MSTNLCQRSTMGGAHAVLAQGVPAREELIQWVSVYGDEVDVPACSGCLEATAGQAPGRAVGLAHCDELIRWVSVCGDEVAWS